MKTKFRLENWNVRKDFHKNYRACGCVYDNPKFHEGKYITTSEILNIAEKNNKIIIHTLNSVYELTLNSYSGNEGTLKEFKTYFNTLSEKMFKISEKLLSVGDSLICNSNIIYSSKSDGLIHIKALNSEEHSAIVFEYPKDNFLLKYVPKSYENLYSINLSDDLSEKNVLYELNLKEQYVNKFDYKSIANVVLEPYSIIEQPDLYAF